MLFFMGGISRTYECIWPGGPGGELLALLQLLLCPRNTGIAWTDTVVEG